MLHVFSATDTNLPTVNYEMPLKFVSALQSSLIILISSCSKHMSSATKPERSTRRCSSYPAANGWTVNVSF